MRAVYLSEDRPDIRYACKESARLLQQLAEGAWEMLKHLGRFLHGALAASFLHGRALRLGPR
eukprot:6978386-Prorocentrum_lima.AAC.1